MLAADPRQAFPGKGVMQLEQAELDRLRKEVAKLKMDRDILKKAKAYFAKESISSSAPWLSHRQQSTAVGVNGIGSSPAN